MVHRYQSNGYNIVLDVNSGLVHVTDQMTYDMIGLMEEVLGENKAVEFFQQESIREDVVQRMMALFAEEKHAAIYKEEAEETLDESNVKVVFTELYDELAAMVADASLFTEDVYEPYIEHFKNRETVVKALCLHIAHDCNLACQYCFAEEGEYHGRRALMSFEVGKRALDFLVENSGTRRNLEVDFFGGEPTQEPVSADPASLTAESTVYAVTNNASSYHMLQICDMQENHRMLTLAEAVAEGLLPCEKGATVTE